MTWAMRRRAAYRQPLLTALMERRGLDPADAARRSRGVALATAARRCLLCEHAVECGRWIETARDDAVAPPFCPNADFLERAASLA